MKVETAQDAGVQELQSVGAFTGILLVISETLRNYGIESPIAMIAASVVVLLANTAWEVYQNDGLIEDLTVPKQLSRLGVNAIVFFVGLAVIGFFLVFTGTSAEDISKHLQVMGVDPSLVNSVLAFCAAAVVYALNRAVVNIILLVVSVVKN